MANTHKVPTESEVEALNLLALTHSAVIRVISESGVATPSPTMSQSDPPILRTLDFLDLATETLTAAMLGIKPSAATPDKAAALLSAWFASEQEGYERAARMADAANGKNGRGKGNPCRK